MKTTVANGGRIETGDGKRGCKLKVVSSSSRHEFFKYHDVTNFLLAGVFARAAVERGAGWTKTSFGDYRAFDGFLLPTRFTSQEVGGRYTIRFNSVEINAVRERDLRVEAMTARDEP